MSASIIGSNDGILTVKISGKLTHAEFAQAQSAAAALLKTTRKMRILVLTENFEGWGQEGDWGDLSFQMDNDQFIEKMAIVGPKKWEDLALVFTAKGFRRFPIEYFQTGELDKARSWLVESSGVSSAS